MTRSLRLVAFLLIVSFAELAHAQSGTVRITLPNQAQRGFYTNVLNCQGIAIKAGPAAEKTSLGRVCRRIEMMLEKLPAAAANLRNRGVEFHIVAREERLSELPEFNNMKGSRIRAHADEPEMDYDTRMRGHVEDLGLVVFASSAEENLDIAEAEPSKTSDMCLHEFAHLIYLEGLNERHRQLIESRFKASLAKGLWTKNYAHENADEFFAELSTWYFGSQGDQSGQHVGSGRRALQHYDPEAYQTIDSIYSGLYRVQLNAQYVPGDTLEALTPDSAGHVSSGGPLCSIRFVNAAKHRVSIYWVDYDWKQVLLAELWPTESLVIPSTVSYPYMVKDERGHPMVEFLAQKGQGTAIIKDN